MPYSPEVERELAQVREEARQYLVEAGMQQEDRPEMLAQGGMRAKARRLVKTRFYPEADVDANDDIYVVWFAKTLQNWKCLISTNVKDDMYYEVTYNGDKHETYIDAYQKVENVCVKDTAPESNAQPTLPEKSRPPRDFPIGA